MRTLLALVILALCASALAGEPDRPRQISMVAVLADPDRFDEKVITVEGFFVAGDEYQHTLYLDETAFDNELVSRSVGIPFGSDGLLAGHTCSYVLVTGKFTSKDYFLGAGKFETVERVLPIKTSKACLGRTSTHLN